MCPLITFLKRERFKVTISYYFKTIIKVCSRKQYKDKAVNIKRNELLIHTMTSVNLKNIIPSEKSQAKMATYDMIPLT